VLDVSMETHPVHRPVPIEESDMKKLLAITTLVIAIDHLFLDGALVLKQVRRLQS
jgi:hypothetical protein